MMMKYSGFPFNALYDLRGWCFHFVRMVIACGDLWLDLEVVMVSGRAPG
jgi:hypothetical protein